LRRVKFLVDQAAVKNAHELFFDEHRVFSNEELLADDEIKMEYLHYYLNVPAEKKRMSASLEVDDDKIYRMIKRKDIIEDASAAYKEEYNQQLDFKDTEEFTSKTYEQMRVEREKRRLAKEIAMAPDEKSAHTDDEAPWEVEISTTGKKKEDKQVKGEREKLIEFLKQKSDQKVKKGAKIIARPKSRKERMILKQQEKVK